ncbi:HK97 family phage portal protein [Mycobacteroides abscessus]|uniref:phage portal protein n=1 Tax=Mycobacteroides abscessus TaxID=36809 RepID=UPI001C6B0667|nr:phage portal protein [Mycobacteroides abscessus]MBE5453498.1 HK97 family phage portal protein [Mycobacteroides abscessus]
MSFFSRIFTGTPASVEERAITSTSFVPTPAEDAAMNGMYGYGSMTPTGTREMQVSAFTACVTLLADTIAALPLIAYRWENGIKVALNPQPIVVTQPFPETTLFDWVWMLVEALCVTGNGFGYITSRGPDDRPRAIMPVHPDCLNVVMPEKDRWPDPEYYVEGEKVSRSEIVHIKRYPIAGAALGLSPVQRAAASIGIALAAERYGLNYFRDSANPSSVLETDMALDPAQARLVQQQWIASHGGRRLPAVLSGGVKWRPIALTPNESQFLEVRKYQRGEIAMLFRVPPHMIGDTEKTTSWGTGIEQQSTGFVRYTLRPWLTCIEQQMSMLLPRGVFVKFDVTDLLRGDIKSLWTAYKAGRDSGVYSVNDIRAREDMEPVEGGDIRLQPTNMAPLGWEPPTTTPAATEPQGDQTPEEEPADDTEPDEGTDEGTGQEDQ